MTAIYCLVSNYLFRETAGHVVSAGNYVCLLKVTAHDRYFEMGHRKILMRMHD